MHLGFSTLTRPGSPQPPTKCGTQQGPHRRAHGQWPQVKVSYYKVSNHLQLCGINSIHITTFTESVGLGTETGASAGETPAARGDSDVWGWNRHSGFSTHKSRPDDSKAELG